MKPKSVYAPLPKSGALHPEIRETIEKHLHSELAIKCLPNVIEHAMNVLEKSDVYMCSYANLVIWFVRAWTAPHFALNHKIPTEFVNQELHDLTVENKLQFIYNHGNIHPRKVDFNSVRRAGNQRAQGI